MTVILYRGTRSFCSRVLLFAMQCVRDGFEVIYRSLLSALLIEGACPHGSIIDAGAQKGHESCLFAESAPQRLVHALDPSIVNVELIQSRYGDRKNLRPMLGALADRPAQGLKDQGPNRQVQHIHTQLRRHHVLQNTTTFDVFTVDGLFGTAGAWQHESLGMMHLDVEGSELSVIQGALNTLKQYQPVVGTELNIHLDLHTSAALLNKLASLGYVSFLVEEVCGVQMDCRNLIHVHRHQLPRFVRSPAFNLVLNSGVAFRVDANSIGNYGFPCCRAGGECCLHGRGHPRCCGEMIVRKWVRERMPNSTASTGELRGQGIFLRETPLFFGGSGSVNHLWRELLSLSKNWRTHV